MGILPSEKYTKLIQVIICRETVDLGMLNNQLVKCIVNPFLNHVNNMNNWSTGSILGLGPRLFELFSHVVFKVKSTSSVLLL